MAQWIIIIFSHENGYSEGIPDFQAMPYQAECWSEKYI
jgi:hypothetical protein